LGAGERRRAGIAADTKAKPRPEPSVETRPRVRGTSDVNDYPKVSKAEIDDADSARNRHVTTDQGKGLAMPAWLSSWLTARWRLRTVIIHAQTGVGS
jgi:hypothetical protein